jgi:hypothetical protein
VTGYRALLLAGAAFALCGCAVEWQREHPLGCRLGEQSMARDTLYFGTQMPDGHSVDADAWQRFESDTLAPAFPRGYTVIDANGVWRDADGHTTNETSRIVVIVHADTDGAAAALRDVVARYRDRFNQESVLQEHSIVCARF